MVSINELPIYIIVIMTVGILAGIGVMVNDALVSDMASIDTQSIYNDTVTNVNNYTWTDLSKAGVALTVSEVTNSSAATTVISSTYYTTNVVSTHNAGPLQIQLTTAGANAGYNKSSLNITYTYGTRNTQFNVLENSSIGISNITEQIPIVGVIVGVAVLVGIIILLLVAIPGKKNY